MKYPHVFEMEVFNTHIIVELTVQGAERYFRADFVVTLQFIQLIMTFDRYFPT